MKLSSKEKQAMSRLYLGGIDALRTETYKASPATIQSLFKKGMLDRNGMTTDGKQIAKELADSGII